MTYNELINRFEVYDNPPKKDGHDRHHIVPESEQVKMYGSVTDNRQIYCSLPQHMWLHILYDRENGTNTAKRFLSVCNKPAEFFTCYELCLAYTYTLRKKREEQFKKLTEVCRTPEFRQKRSALMKEVMKNPEVRQKIANAMKGEKNPMYSQHHPEETRQKIADSMKGESNPMKRPEIRQRKSDSMKGKPGYNKGRKWWNNGVISVMAYECPEGFIEGRLYQRRANEQ